MRKILYFFVRNLYFRLYRRACQILTIIYFALNGVEHRRAVCIGIPNLDIHPDGKCTLGTNVSLVSNSIFATLGKNNRCKLMVYPNARLVIGNNVGISNSTLVATMSVEIGDNVMIGGGVIIVDSDFHSLNPIDWHGLRDEKNMKKSPVVIGDNVFIGMDSIILKGVHVGSNSIIASGSVLSENVPPNQVWGGNPAKYIRNNLVPNAKSVQEV